PTLAAKSAHAALHSTFVLPRRGSARSASHIMCVVLAPETPARVLVVDDDSALSSVFERILSTEGYAVHTAADYDSARKIIDRDSPDVILLDVMLPGPDGFTICKRLKDDATTRLTPVILVTA